MAVYHIRHKIFSRSTHDTVGVLAYCTGTTLTNGMTQEVADYSQKPVQHVEVLLPTYAASWAHELKDLVATHRTVGIQKLSDFVESYEKRVDSQVYRELELSLPVELSDEQNIKLVNEFIKDECCTRGMVAIQNFHFNVDAATGQRNPHCHTLLLTRVLTQKGLSSKKSREWNQRSFHDMLMKKWADYQNNHLARHGFEAEVYYKTYEDKEFEIALNPREQAENFSDYRASKQEKDPLPLFPTWMGSMFQRIKKNVQKLWMWKPFRGKPMKPSAGENP